MSYANNETVLVTFVLAGLAVADDKQQAQDEFNKGMAFKRKRDYDAAITCFDKAIRLAPDYVEAYGYGDEGYFGVKLDLPSQG